MTGIDAVIFDFDGTLADTQQATMTTFIQALDELSMPLDATLLSEEMTALSVADMFRSIGLEESRIANACGLYKEIYQTTAPQCAALFPGVEPTLQALGSWGFKLAIATNESRENLDTLLSAFGIAHLFQASCCADEVPRSKPFPDMGIRILHTLGIAPPKALMVGDSIFDMALGKTLGLRTCAVGYGAYPLSQLREQDPDKMIQGFSELLNLLVRAEFIRTTHHGRLGAAG
ncbi:MAG: HAD family hydrolase [Desulfobacterium sp.]|nr:HAD family hydrolase [Desulfobacterium sp.]